MKKTKWHFGAWRNRQYIAFGVDWCYTRKDGLTEFDIIFLCWGFGWVKY